MSKVELWPVVAKDKDEIIRFATETECHGTPKLRHRTVFVAVFNSDDQILLQQRSLAKSLYPRFYTLSATGHVIKDEEYEQAAAREFGEELGVKPNKLIEVVRMRIDLPEHPSWSVLYRTITNGPFKPRAEEIQGVNFFDLAQLPAMKDHITPPSKILLTAAGWLK